MRFCRYSFPPFPSSLPLPPPSPLPFRLSSGLALCPFPLPFLSALPFALLSPAPPLWPCSLSFSSAPPLCPSLCPPLCPFPSAPSSLPLPFAPSPLPLPLCPFPLPFPSAFPLCPRCRHSVSAPSMLATHADVALEHHNPIPSSSMTFLLTNSLHHSHCWALTIGHQQLTTVSTIGALNTERQSQA